MERIFTRAVGGFKKGEIRDLDWDAIRASLRQHHGIEDPLEAYSLPVEEAARRYVLHEGGAEGRKASKEPARSTV